MTGSLTLKYSAEKTRGRVQEFAWFLISVAFPRKASRRPNRIPISRREMAVLSRHAPLIQRTDNDDNVFHRSLTRSNIDKFTLATANR